MEGDYIYRKIEKLKEQREIYKNLRIELKSNARSARIAEERINLSIKELYIDSVREIRKYQMQLRRLNHT